MENFTFYNPTTIEFGADKEQAIGEHVARKGLKKVLLCYGSERIKRDGLFSTITQRLAEQGIEWIEFGGIVSNPVISTVRQGITLARDEQVDGILSVGGGSVLDSAKAIAAGVFYKGDVWDLFIGEAKITAALPLFAIMTLAATGSEMNSFSVVTNEETKEKFFIFSPHIFPVVSIVNPRLMQSVSREYLVYSAADIIAHCIEGYFTAETHPNLQSRLVESIINTVIESTNILLREPTNEAARGEFAWAATLALNGLTTAGCSNVNYPNHAIEHSLSALFNVPHGAGLSVVIPAWMKWYHTQNPQQFMRFAKHIFGESSAEQGIAALESWFNEIGTPTRIEQLGIKEIDLPAIEENIQIGLQQFGLAEQYTPDIISNILHRTL